MPRLKKQGSFYSLIFSEKEALDAGLKEQEEFEISRAMDGIWVMKAKSFASSDSIESPELIAEKKFLELIESLDLSERVQGALEKKLTEAENKLLKKLVSEKKIIEFKLSEKYKKPIYKTAREIEEKSMGKKLVKETASVLQEKKDEKKSASSSKQVSSPAASPDLASGYLILSNESLARNFSDMHSKELKEGLLKGLKCFDGSYCVVKKELFESESNKVIALLGSKDKASLDELSKELNMDKALVRVLIEFLKEDGLIIEKKKDIFRLIK